MSRNREYPRFGSEHQTRGPGPCVVCEQMTRTVVDIQWDWFRGNDDVVRCCRGRCRNMQWVCQGLETRAAKEADAKRAEAGLPADELAKLQRKRERRRRRRKRYKENKRAREAAKRQD